MDNLRRQYLQAMGIPVWVRRQQPGEVDSSDITPAPLDMPHELEELSDAQAISCATWQVLEGRVASCTTCDLHSTRTQTVFGTGDREADWMFIGEAPGADEDRQGEPFVGRAGQLLNAMIQAIGLGREQVYIANILKCRPPRNRDPRPEEVACCERYLHRQVELVQPRVILALGRIAAHNLLKTDVSLGRMRGRCYRYSDTQIPVVVTYHPAYLLRSPNEKRKAWQDLQFATRMYAEGE